MAHGPEQGGRRMESADGVVVILRALNRWKAEPERPLGDFVTPEMVGWLIDEVIMMRTVSGEMLRDLRQSHDEIITYLRVKRYGDREQD